MKKLLYVILAVAIVCGSLPLGTLADSSGISVGPLNFNQATTADDIANIITDNGSLFGTQYVISNANGSYSENAVVEPHNWTNDVGATDIDKQLGTSVAIKNKNAYPGIKIMATNVGTENIVTEFSIKKTGINKKFYCDYRVSSADIFMLVFDDTGYVKLCNNNMVKYEPNTWYDVKLVFNPKKVYTRLYLKKHGENGYKTYDAFYFADCIGTAAIDLSNGISGIDLGYLSQGEETTYIDNVSYYTKDVGDATPSMSSLNDDFANGISTFDEGSNADDYARQWRVENRANTDNTLKLETKEIDGKKALTMSAAKGYPVITKLVSDLPEDSTSIIKFGLGRAADTGMYFYINGVDMFSLSGNNLYVSSGDNWGGFNVGKISNFELVINRKQKIARVILNTNGRIYMSDLNKLDFTKQIGSVGFMMPGGSGKELYLSDFQYDITDNNTCKLERAYLESGYSDNSAALDDKIVFEFNQSVAYKFVDGLETIPCTLAAADGNKVECTATMSLTEWNKVIVTPLKTLKPNTKYTVEVSGVQGGYDEGTISASYTFTTAADEFSFAKPVIASDGTITLDAKAYVNQEKSAVLIAAAYDADGNCVEVQYTDIVAKKTNGTISFKPNFSADHKTVSAFVWSDFSEMTPYSEQSESN